MSEEVKLYREVKASSGLPKRDGYYNGVYSFLPVVIDIVNGKIKSVTFGEGKVNYNGEIGHPQLNIENLEWFEPYTPTVPLELEKLEKKVKEISKKYCSPVVERDYESFFEDIKPHISAMLQGKEEIIKNAVDEYQKLATVSRYDKEQISSLQSQLQQKEEEIKWLKRAANRHMKNEEESMDGWRKCEEQNRKLRSELDEKEDRIKQLEEVIASKK